MKKILIVDDEPSIITLLKFNLEKEGYEVTTAENGKDAYEIASTQSFDFIILDIMLPLIDGIEVTKKLRQEKIDTPILILTAKDDSVDRILGLEIGADDYLTKPFSPREIIARMKAISRRLEPRSTLDDNESLPETLRAGNILCNLADHQVTVNNLPVELTPKEFELLVYFMKRKGRVISRDTLLDRIWHFDFDGQNRIVDVHIGHLREKVENDPKHPKYIQTVRGFGYKFQE